MDYDKLFADAKMAKEAAEKRESADKKKAELDDYNAAFNAHLYFKDTLTPLFTRFAESAKRAGSDGIVELGQTTKNSPTEGRVQLNNSIKLSLSKPVVVSSISNSVAAGHPIMVALVHRDTTAFELAVATGNNYRSSIVSLAELSGDRFDKIFADLAKSLM